ncbi:MAG: efflux RND transporter periplasmic adaptor subunit [Sulfurospirillaceae bacterium]|nr:efflux RND transporter periplasmic adaptor subunit [Sulfurospirillaceae bacterium]MDD2826661.1 efflux RND transporter periplasmic adaptor subunit [Sulfurospirillaceae bacterium]
MARLTLTLVSMMACIALSTILFAEESSQKTPTAQKTAPVPAVDVYKVSAPKEEALSLTYPGKSISSQVALIKARANGILQKKHFTEGQIVKEGELLYTIEPDSYEAAFQLAKANLASQDVILQKTEKEWKRLKSLFDANAASEQEKDTAFWAYESAKASYESSKASLKVASINLDRTRVKATMSGIVGMKQTDVGTLVTDGTPLVEITQVNPLHVEFSIPDIDVMKQKYNIKNGTWSHPSEGKLKATLMVNNVQYKESGVVDFLDSSLNSKTGSLKARATFKNPNQELLPNQFVTVSLLGLTRNNVIRVPQKAVLQNPLGMVVFIVVDGKAVVKPVKIGETSGNDFIIENGLKEGDLVIVNNFFRVKNAAPVKIDKVINQTEAQ